MDSETLRRRDNTKRQISANVRDQNIWSAARTAQPSRPNPLPPLAALPTPAPSSTTQADSSLQMLRCTPFIRAAHFSRCVIEASATANACTALKGARKSRVYAPFSILPNCITCLSANSIWKFFADSCVTRPPKSSW